MLFGLIPDEEKTAGRSGLWKVNVTPLLYLQLLDKLESGQRVSYNKTQLQFAFKKYLNNTKGPWKREKIPGFAGLDRFAVNFIEKQQDKFKAEQQKDARNNPGKSPSKKEEKTLQLLQKFHLLPTNDKKLPTNLQGSKRSEKQEEIQFLQNARKTFDVAEILSMAGEPTTTVAVGLILIAMESSAIDKVISTFFDCYSDKAKNSEEKAVIIAALNKVMGNVERLKFAEKIDDLKTKELDPEKHVELEKLKHTPPKNEVHRKFLENSNMAKLQVDADFDISPKATAKSVFGVLKPTNSFYEDLLGKKKDDRD